MNAHKVEVTLAKNGTLTLEGLPFHAGDAVEVIILERSDKQSRLPMPSATNPYPLQGKQPYRYDDPFEPAVPPEDWEVLQ
jgi:hypothetical protein